MASKTNAISHLTYATEWDHVSAKYMVIVEIDGETFEKPADKAMYSEPVLAAAIALEEAIIAELQEQDPTATVTTLRALRAPRPQ